MIWCEKVQPIINAFDSNETYDTATTLPLRHTTRHMTQATILPLRCTSDHLLLV